MNYRLTDNKKVFNGETLFQIECVEDCKYAKVGELGGYIASYDNLEDGAWVNEDVCVCDTSVVKGYVKGGFVAGNSIVAGKVNGAVINSCVDENSELDCSILLYSNIMNTKHKGQVIGSFSSAAMILLSKITNSELIGNILIAGSYIEESTINWNNVEKMNVCGNLGIQEFLNEETGEIEHIEHGKERFTKANEELIKEWKMNMNAMLNDKNIQTEDEEADKLFNENRISQFKNEENAERVLSATNDMGNFYKGFFGETVYSMLMMYLNGDEE